MLLAGLGRGEAEVIEDQDILLLEPAESLRVGAVGSSQCQLVEEPWEPVVADAVALAARGLAEGAGEVALADARLAGDQHVDVVMHPGAGAELTIAGSPRCG